MKRLKHMMLAVMAVFWVQSSFAEMITFKHSDGNKTAQIDAETIKQNMREHIYPLDWLTEELRKQYAMDDDKVLGVFVNEKRVTPDNFKSIPWESLQTAKTSEIQTIPYMHIKLLNSRDPIDLNFDEINLMAQSPTPMKYLSKKIISMKNLQDYFKIKVLSKGYEIDDAFFMKEYKNFGNMGTFIVIITDPLK